MSENKGRLTSKGKLYAVHCPVCEKSGKGKLQRYDYSKKDKTFFYKCYDCKNEFFDWEISKELYKTAKFKNEDGEIKFVPQSEKAKNNREKRVSYKSKKFGESSTRKRGISKNEYKLLRKLRK